VNDALSLQVKELGEFTYAAGHDLQEPLRTIAGYTQLLANSLEGCRDSEGAEIVSAVLGSVQRMQTIIRDILFYSHIVHGSELSLVELDCNAVLDQVLLGCRATIQESQAIVTRDLLPTVYADEAQFARIFQNLISNAIKYRQPNQLPRVHISAVEGRTSGGLKWQTTALGSILNIPSTYSDFLSGSTASANTGEAEWALPSVSRLSNDTAAASGRSPNRGVARGSSSHCRGDHSDPLKRGPVNDG